MNEISGLVDYFRTRNVAVCYSGGLDSTVLLAHAAVARPNGHLGIFVRMPMTSAHQIGEAERIADELGARMTTVFGECNGRIVANGPERCYHCKVSMYDAAKEEAIRQGFDGIICGENADDLSADRPGRQAGTEADVGMPLVDLCIGRAAIERCASSLGLSAPLVKETCLATRLPQGTPLTSESLALVETLEDIVRRLAGVRQVRVRISAAEVNVLTSPDETAGLLKAEQAIKEEFSLLGIEDPKIGLAEYKG